MPGLMHVRQFLLNRPASGACPPGLGREPGMIHREESQKPLRLL